MDTLAQQKRRSCVPQVVEPQSRQADPCQRGLEDLRQIRAVEGTTACIGEDEIAVFLGRSERQALLELTGSMRAQCHHGRLRQRDLTARTRRLRRDKHEAIASPLQGRADPENCGVKVDVSPPQAKEFTLPHPRRYRQDVEGFKTCPSDRSDEHARLVW